MSIGVSLSLSTKTSFFGGLNGGGPTRGASTKFYHNLRKMLD